MAIITRARLDAVLDVIDDYRDGVPGDEIVRRHDILDHRAQMYSLLRKWGIERDREQRRERSVTKAKHDYETAEEIRRKWNDGNGEYETQKELAAEYGYASPSSISAIVRYERYAEPPEEEPDMSHLTPCERCGMLCEGDLCAACQRELGRGIRHEEGELEEARIRRLLEGER